MVVRAVDIPAQPETAEWLHHIHQQLGPQLGEIERRELYKVAVYCFDDRPGGPDTVHLKTIATNAGMPISKAKRYLRRLEQAGFLTFYTHAGKRDGKKLWNRLDRSC